MDIQKTIQWTFKVFNRSVQWLQENPDAHNGLLQVVMLLPVAIRAKVVIYRFTPTRILSCVLCGTSCTTHDPCLGEFCLLLWAHLTADGELEGMVCHYCRGAMSRRYKGWKLRELKDHLASNEDKQKQFEDINT